MTLMIVWNWRHFTKPIVKHRFVSNGKDNKRDLFKSYVIHDGVISLSCMSTFTLSMIGVWQRQKCRVYNVREMEAKGW